MPKLLILAAAFPCIYYTLRRTNDVTFSEAGKCSRFCISDCCAVLNKIAKSHIIMKKKSQSGKVPVSKLQAFLSELSGMLSQEGSEFFVNRSDDGTTSIRLARGQYLTISMQKGGRS